MQNEKLINYINLGIFAILSLIVLWSMRLGFDFTDEGFHIMTLAHPEESNVRFQYQHFIEQILGPFNLGIIGFKFIRLFLTVLGTTIFTYGLYSWQKSNSFFNSAPNVNWGGMLGFIGIGSFMSYSLQPRTLSYNNLTLFLILTIIGILLYFISQVSKEKPNPSKLSNGLLFIVGWLLLFLFFAKFPVAIVLGALTYGGIIVLSYYRSIPILNILKSLAFVTLGIIFCAAYFHLTIENWQDWTISAKEELNTIAGHNAGSLIKMYFTTSYNSCYRAVVGNIEVPIAIFSLFMIYIGYNKKNTPESENYNPNAKWIFRGIFALILLYTFSLGFFSNYFKSGMNYNRFAFDIYVLIFFCFCLISLTFLTEEKVFEAFGKPANIEVLLVASVLFILPAVGAVGTNNQLPLQCIQYLFSWFAIFYIISQIISRNLKFVYISSAFLLLTSIFATAQILSGHLFRPYRVTGTVFEQTASIENLPNANRMLFHPRQKKYVEGVYSILKEKTDYQFGDPMISFNSPGLVYLIGGVSPGASWFHKKGKFNHSNCQKVQSSNIKDKDKTIIIKEKDAKINNHVKGCWQKEGIKFPESYVLVGELPSNVVGNTRQIYVPKVRVSQKTKNDAIRKEIKNLQKRLAEKESGQLHFQVGKKYRELDEIEKAIKAFKKALDLNPKMENCRLVLAYTYFNQNNFNLAKEQCEIILKDNSSNKKTKQLLKKIKKATK